MIDITGYYKYITNKLLELNLEDFLTICGFDSCLDAIEECNYNQFLELQRDCSDAVSKLEDNLTSDYQDDVDGFLSEQLHIRKWTAILGFMQTHCVNFLRQLTNEHYENECNELRSELESLTKLKLD